MIEKYKQRSTADPLTLLRIRELREPPAPYNGDSMPENDRLSAQNMHFLDIYRDNTNTWLGPTPVKVLSDPGKKE
jgi:hypothetical protein